MLCRYGPFWICSTLIFVAASIGTFVTYISHKVNNKEWNYDINLVTWSAGLFYGYVTIVPLGLYIILKYFSAPSGLVQLLCLYGYSLFVFIPALVSSLILKYFLLSQIATFSNSSYYYYFMSTLPNLKDFPCTLLFSFRIKFRYWELEERILFFKAKKYKSEFINLEMYLLNGFRQDDVA